MPVVASATLEVTPVLSGAQQSLTEQLTGAAEPASEAAGKKSGSKLASGLAKGIAAGSVAVAGAVAGTSAALISAAGATAEYGDQIDKASQKMGVSSTFYQEWDAVLQHSGTSMDSMSATFKKLANASQNASKDQVAAFEAIGLSMDDVAKMSAEDLFGSVISGLQGMEEGTERTAIATQLLGKGAMELGPLMNTSAEDTQAMIDRVHELGGVMGEDSVKAAAAYQDSLQDMQTALDGVKRGVIADLLPVLTTFMDQVGDFISNTDLTPLTSVFSSAISVLGKFIKSLDISAIAGTFQSVITTISTVVETAWSAMSTVFDALQGAFATISDALGTTDADWSGVWADMSAVVEGAADVISGVIGVIADAIAWVVGEVQTEGSIFNGVWNSMAAIVEGFQGVISGVVSFVSALIRGDWSGAWNSAKSIVSTIWNTIKAVCSNVWNSIKSTAKSVWNGIKEAMTQPIQSARDTISGILDRIRGFFPLSIGRIFSNFHLPHISVSGGSPPFGIGGMGSLPHFSVEWYAKAMNQPYVFDKPTIFGAGEAGEEIMYGRENLLRDIREASGNGTTNVYVTVNGAESPEEWAVRFAKEFKLQARTA